MALCREAIESSEAVVAPARRWPRADGPTPRPAARRIPTFAASLPVEGRAWIGYGTGGAPTSNEASRPVLSKVTRDV